jgi:PI31 proteasome regulator N-terminal/PI31 proteasome regulator
MPPERHEHVTPLPREWNASSSYAFRYTHAQSSMEYLVKTNRLGSKAVIFGIGLGDDKTVSFDIPVKDYLSASSFPLAITGSVTEEFPDSQRGKLEKALQNAFISEPRSSDLAALFKLNIIQKLIPGLRKEGYEESGSSYATAATSASSTSDQYPTPPRGPRHDPLRDDGILPTPARPDLFGDPPLNRPVPPGDLPPPGFEDEYEINRPPRGYAPGFGGRHPLSIGDNDLYPPGLGPHDPLRGSFGGGLPGFGGTRGGGGMHPTFDDPLFGGRGGQREYDPR